MRRLVPDELWELCQRVVPPSPTRPQGGGRRRVDGRLILAAIVFVATSGCTWRQLPPVFGASWQTVHRRFAEWSAAWVWAKLYRITLDELGARGELDWSRCAIDSVCPPRRRSAHRLRPAGLVQPARRRRRPGPDPARRARYRTRPYPAGRVESGHHHDRRDHHPRSPQGAQITFPLFDLDERDYDMLYASKLELLMAVNAGENLTWNGPRHIQNATVFPGPSSR